MDLLAIACVLGLAIWWRLLPLVFETPEFWLTALAMTYVLAVIALAGVPDLWWAMKPPRVLINYAGVFMCVTYAICRFGRYRTLLMFHNAVFLHAVVVLGMAFSPGFNQLISGAFGGVTKSTFQISGLTRSLALTSMVMMFPFVTYPLFALLEGYRERWIGVKLAVIFAATCFMGRTGMYLCLGGSAFALIGLVAAGRIPGRRVVVPAGLAVAAASALVFSVVTQRAILPSVALPTLFVEPVVHMLEPFDNYRRGLGFTAASIEHIRSMPVVYHNDTPIEVAFGTGLYGRGDVWTYLPTDVAYLHMFSAFGVMGVFLMLLAYAITLPANRRFCDRASYWAVAAIIVMTMVANAKETALFTRHIYTIHVTLLALLAFDRRAERPSDPPL